jgi:hypothetical protein
MCILRHIREDIIKMYFEEIECRGVDWVICLREGISGRLLNMVMNLQVP